MRAVTGAFPSFLFSTSGPQVPSARRTIGLLMVVWRVSSVLFCVIILHTCGVMAETWMGYGGQITAMVLCHSLPTTQETRGRLLAHVMERRAQDFRLGWILCCSFFNCSILGSFCKHRRRPLCPELYGLSDHVVFKTNLGGL